MQSEHATRASGSVNFYFIARIVGEGITFRCRSWNSLTSSLQIFDMILVHAVKCGYTVWLEFSKFLSNLFFHIHTM